MRRLWLLVPIFLMISLACDFSNPVSDFEMPEVDLSEIEMPDIEMPELDLNQLSIDTSQSVTGSGNVVDEERRITDYSEVTLAGVGNLIMEQGDSEGLRIQAEDNLIQYIRVEVNNGKLIIGIQPGITVRPTQPINYFLKVKTIEAISLSGSGGIETPGLMGRRIKVTMGGSGHIKILNLDANSIEARLNGSGDMEIAGKIQTTDVTIDGAGNFLGSELECNSAKVKIPGSGSAFVNPLDRLDVNISGSGTVHYKGFPDVKQNISGSGQVVQEP